MTDKAEKHRLAVMKYREKLGIDKVREMTKEYTKKVRDNPEYKQKELEKNRLRAREKSNELKIEKLNSILEAITVSEEIINSIYEETIDELPVKRGRGRPKLTEEQKAERKTLRNTKLLSTIIKDDYLPFLKEKH